MKINVRFTISRSTEIVVLSASDLGLTEDEWKNLSLVEQESKLDEYYNAHRDSLVYWNVEEIETKYLTNPNQ
jgi:hypothetical protein